MVAQNEAAHAARDAATSQALIAAGAQMVAPPLPPRTTVTAIATWRHEPRVWIDTEVADWATKAPRLSLLQVRTRTGWNCVADVLNPAMRNVLDEEFIPQVMENEAVEKWAHSLRR
jgi:ribonuclease D